MASLALRLFDDTTELHKLDAHHRELLEYAALLHDIGEHIAHDGHDRHAAYLIRHGALRGFTPQEITLLAALARWHRRGDPEATEELGSLSTDNEVGLRCLAALLRLADGLDRGHTQAVRDVHVRVRSSLVLIHLETESDVELDVWGARSKRQPFERVFGREVEITRHPTRLLSALGRSPSNGAATRRSPLERHAGPATTRSNKPANL